MYEDCRRISGGFADFIRVSQGLYISCTPAEFCKHFLAVLQTIIAALSSSSRSLEVIIGTMTLFKC